MTDKDHPHRHLRAVPTGELPSLIMPQVADMPGAYTVRRPGDQAAAAIVTRDAAGWLVMYGYDPDAVIPWQQWRASAVLPGRLSDAVAGRYALELADAYAVGVPQWHGLLAAAMTAGELPLAIARLHSPANLGGRHHDCAAEGGRCYWLACPTVRVLAGGLGVTLPPAPDGY